MKIKFSFNLNMWFVALAFAWSIKYRFFQFGIGPIVVELRGEALTNRTNNTVSALLYPENDELMDRLAEQYKRAGYCQQNDLK